MFFNVVHALAAEAMTEPQRAVFAAELGHPVPPPPPGPAATTDEDEPGGDGVVVPDTVPAWMQGLIP